MEKSLDDYVKMIQTLETENHKLKKRLSDKEKEVLVLEEKNNEKVNKLSNRILLFKSLVNIPESVAGLRHELVKARLAYFELLRDRYETGHFPEGENFDGWQGIEGVRLEDKSLEKELERLFPLTK